MAVIRSHAMKALRDHLAHYVPDLEGAIGAGPCEAPTPRQWPHLNIWPIRFTFHPDQELEFDRLGASRAVFAIGRFEGLVQLRLGATTHEQRLDLEDQVLEAFMVQEGRPGVIVTEIEECHDAVVAWELEGETWENEYAFDKKWYSVIECTVQIPALVTRDGVYAINDLRLTVAHDMETDLDEVGEWDMFTASIDEDGNLTAVTERTWPETPVRLAVSTEYLALVEDGSPGTFTVQLTRQPAAGTYDVDVVSSDETIATVDLPLLQFTEANWNTPQTVTVTPTEDDANITDDIVNVTLTAVSLGDAKTVRCEMQDLGVPVAPLVIVASKTDVYVTEPNGTDTFTVVLSRSPVEFGSVTVAVASSDTSSVTVDTPSLSFGIGDWDTPQTVTVTAISDIDAVAETPTIALTSDDAVAANVTANVTEARNTKSLALIAAYTQYLSTNDPGGNVYDGGTGLTFYVWYRPRTLPGTGLTHILHAKWIGSGGARSWKLALQNISGTHWLAASVSQDGNLEEKIRWQLSPTPTLGVWMQLVIRWDTTQTPAANRARLWINGVEKSSPTTDADQSITAIRDSVTAVTVGYHSATSPADGDFDAPILYNTAKNPTTILSDWNNYKNAPESNLQVGSNLNGDTGDFSGNSRTINVIGSPSPLYISDTPNHSNKVTGTHYLSLTRSLSQYAYAEHDALPSLQPTTDFTVGLWLNPTTLDTSLTTNGYGLAGKWNGNTNNRSWLVYLIYSGGNWQIRAGYSSNGTNSNMRYWVIPVVAGTWIHFAASVDLDADPSLQWAGYINGVAQGTGSNVTATASTTIYAASGARVTVGAHRGGADVADANFFDGKIADLRMYNAILGATRITSEWRADIAAQDASLTGYFLKTNTLTNLVTPANTLVAANGAAMASGRAWG